MRLNNVAVALCHVHKKHLGQAWRQETDAGICFEKKTIVGHCLGKYLNRTLIIQNILLKWFNDWHKSTKKPNQQMQGWPAEEGCRGSGAEGTGIPLYCTVIFCYPARKPQEC